jgi:hypothetical protein
MYRSPEFMQEDVYIGPGALWHSHKQLHMDYGFMQLIKYSGEVFVKGHDFSRAAESQQKQGLQPLREAD